MKSLTYISLLFLTDCSTAFGFHFLDEPEDHTVKHGAVVILTCRTEPSTDVKVMWFRNGQNFAIRKGKSTRRSNVQWTKSAEFLAGAKLIRYDKLKLRVRGGRRKSNIGRYKCKAYKGEQVITSRTATINKAYLRRRFQMRPPVETIVTRGHKAYIPCEAPAGSPKANVTWLFEGHELDGDPLRRTLWGGSLGIEHAVPEHAGRYVCVAQNTAAKRWSKPTILKVL